MFGPPVQIAYAVADVHAAAHEWARRGVGPFFVLEHIPLDRARLRGEWGRFDHSSAYAQWGPVMVELICQHDAGPEPIVPASGLHHVAFFVADFDDAAADLTSRGCVEVLRAETSTGMPFAFHDARHTLGHLVEIYERRPGIDRFYAMVRDAAAGWDGSDPVRVLS